mgnify:CR=1 FL=1
MMNTKTILCSVTMLAEIAAVLIGPALSRRGHHHDVYQAVDDISIRCWISQSVALTVTALDIGNQNVNLHQSRSHAFSAVSMIIMHVNVFMIDGRNLRSCSAGYVVDLIMTRSDVYRPISHHHPLNVCTVSSVDVRVIITVVNTRFDVVIEINVRIVLDNIH